MRAVRWYLNAALDPVRMGIALYILAEGADGKHYSLTEEGWEPIDEGMYAPSVITVQPGEAQSLVDGLWRANVRPTDTIMVEGEKGAMRQHLNDMRVLVSKVLKVELPE